jgi:hypothetical protein
MPLRYCREAVEELGVSLKATGNRDYLSVDRVSHLIAK